MTTNERDDVLIAPPPLAVRGKDSIETAALARTVPYEQLPEYLRPEEFRAYLGLGRNTVYDLLRRGEIPHLRFGRTIRIPKAALRAPVVART
jgi:excisionase family DNA binding protein